MGACMGQDYVVDLCGSIRVHAENKQEAREKAIAELQQRPELLAVWGEE